MKAVFYILPNPLLLHEVLDAVHSVGIHGGTIFETRGMAKELARQSDFKVAGFLRAMFSSTEDLKHSCTLLFVLPEGKVELLKNTIMSVVGDLTKPDTGILFSIPIDFIVGLKT